MLGTGDPFSQAGRADGTMMPPKGTFAPTPGVMPPKGTFAPTPGRVRPHRPAAGTPGPADPGFDYVDWLKGHLDLPGG